MHPILLKLGSFEIRTYGVSIALAFLVSILLASRLAKKDGIKGDPILDIGLVSIICAVIGARILYVLIWWKDVYSLHPVDVFKVWEGGLVFYGGLIGAIIGCVVYIKKNSLPLLRLGDICMPFLALGHSIGRIGCFFNGCCYGAVNDQCGVIFPAIGDNRPHLPTQLYESALNFLNFVVLLLIFKKKKTAGGLVFYMYFVNYGIIRIIMEMFRGDIERGTIFSLSTSTAISILVIAAGVAGIIYVSVKNGKEKTS
jgi:phosphatidylglycerol:prolipoprotein diacylglycerol transferase